MALFLESLTTFPPSCRANKILNFYTVFCCLITFIFVMLLLSDIFSLFCSLNWSWDLWPDDWPLDWLVWMLFWLGIFLAVGALYRKRRISDKVVVPCSFLRFWYESCSLRNFWQPPPFSLKLLSLNHILLFNVQFLGRDKDDGVRRSVVSGKKVGENWSGVKKGIICLVYYIAFSVLVDTNEAWKVEGR